MTPAATILCALMGVSVAIGYFVAGSALEGVWAGVALCAAWLWFVGAD